MAVITVVKKVDDLDGSEAKHSVRISIDGRSTQVDLSPVNYKEYITPLLKAGSDVTRKRSEGRRYARKASKFSTLSLDDKAQCREWVGRERGQIRDSEVDAWLET